MPNNPFFKQQVPQNQAPVDPTASGSLKFVTGQQMSGGGPFASMFSGNRPQTQPQGGGILDVIQKMRNQPQMSGQTFTNRRLF